MGGVIKGWIERGIERERGIDRERDRGKNRERIDRMIEGKIVG